MGGLVGEGDNLQACSRFVLQVLGDGSNERRLLAAIGLLQSVDKPPSDLVASVMKAFTAAGGETLTEQQRNAAIELGRILGDGAADAVQVAPCCDLSDFAARLLGIIGDHQALEPLIAALRSGRASQPLRSEAARALGKIRDPDAVETPIATTRDPDGTVRRVAIEALGKIRAQDAVEPLVRIDPDAMVCVSAIRALEKIGAPRALSEVEQVARQDIGKTWRGISAAKVAREIAERLQKRTEENQ